jgi:hypothetical protein
MAASSRVLGQVVCKRIGKLRREISSPFEPLGGETQRGCLNTRVALTHGAM